MFDLITFLNIISFFLILALYRSDSNKRKEIKRTIECELSKHKFKSQQLIKDTLKDLLEEAKKRDETVTS
jgi:hypothetical protein